MAATDLCESFLLKDKSNAAVNVCTDCDEKLAQIVSFEKYCSLHDNMELDFFCTSHDTTCCPACITTTHKSCEDVVPLKEASKDIQNSSLLTETLDELINIEHMLQTVLKSNETNMKRIDISAKWIIQEITAYKKRLIEKLDDVEKQLMHKLSTTQNNLKTEMKETKSFVEVKMIEIEKRKHDLEFLKEHGTNNQLFLALHKYDKEINDMGTKISELISSCKDTDIHYDKTATDIESLGKISQTSRPCDVKYTPLKLKQAQAQIPSDHKPRSLTTFKRDSAITLKKGKHYQITDIAVTGDNKLLLCNFSETSPKIYIYTDCKHFETELTFSSPPYKIAVIPDTRRAFVSLEASIQFFNTITMAKEDKIKLRFEPYAVTASHERIFIGGYSEIHVYDTKGVFQKTISVSGISNILFIKLIKHNTEVLCRGPEELCCVDLDGNILYRYKVSGAAGIAVDGQGDVYVGEYHASKIHRLSPEGKLREIILTEDDGINSPYAMTFNNDLNKLFIVGNDYDTVSYFACSGKGN